MNYIKRIFSQNKSDIVYDKIDTTKKIEYPDGTMYDSLYESVKKFPDFIALEYYGRNISYKNFNETDFSN